MKPMPTSSAEFFEAKYRDQKDPWNFAKDHYELQRYNAIVAALTNAIYPIYKRAFEPGCSVGVLTEQLAAISEAVVAIDFSPSAIEQASARCAHLGNVTFRCAPLSEGTDFSGFDLIVLSEIGYYFSPEEWQRLTTNIVASMAPHTTLLAAHWLGHSEDHPMHGERVHEILCAQTGISLQHAERHVGFRLDRWVRV